MDDLPTLRTALNCELVAAALEAMVWSYAVGKPSQSLNVRSRGPSLAALIAGTASSEYDEDDEDN